ncbi:hypothetical protein IKF15_03355 [Candidatus Saccharibacteria bacterium]|nr:hypothetical protein [Candidatus Saccharibacteria bacterium]
MMTSVPALAVSQISSTGWQNIGVNEVQVDLSKMKLHNAEFTPDNDDLKMITDGVEYDFGLVDSNGGAIASYRTSDTSGSTIDLGSFTLKWRDIARLADGSLCDLVLRVHATAYHGGKFGTPILIFADRGLLLDSPMVGTNYSATIDMTSTFLKSGTNQKVNAKIAQNFIDIDQPAYGGVYQNPDDSIPDYVESIQLLEGFNDVVYLEPDYYLNISENPATPRFSATRNTATIADARRAGLITLADAGEFRYRWTGRGSGTGLGFIDSLSVETSVSGDYADKVTISPSQTGVLWKNSYPVSFTVKRGYTLSRLLIDGENYDYAALADYAACDARQSACTYNYIFKDIVSNHSIDVRVVPLPTEEAVSEQGNEEDPVVPDGVAPITPYSNNPAKPVANPHTADASAETLKLPFIIVGASVAGLVVAVVLYRRLS